MRIGVTDTKCVGINNTKITPEPLEKQVVQAIAFANYTAKLQCDRRAKHNVSRTPRKKAWTSKTSKVGTLCILRI